MLSDTFLPLIFYHVKLGFQFHHARPDHVMMTKWLPTTEANNLPNFANHYIGQLYITLALKFSMICNIKDLLTIPLKGLLRTILFPSNLPPCIQV